jgi:hypothetical protein
MFLTLLAVLPILVLVGLGVGNVRLRRRVDELEQERARRLRRT